MSRHIQTKDPENSKLNNNSQNGKLILTDLNGRNTALLLQNDILTWAQVFDCEQTDRIGQVYIAKVKNVVANIEAYFVEIAAGEICYLSMKDAKHARVLNRRLPSGDVKLVQGDELPVQIIRNSIKTKPAAVTCSIELQNDYFVLKADDPGLGISNKLSKEDTLRIRKQLEACEENISEKGAGPSFYAIARTLCRELDEEYLTKEYQKMRTAFCNLYEKAGFRTCFSCIYSDTSPIKAVLKQVPAYEYDEIITDIPEVFQAIRQDMMTPKAVRLYNDQQFPLTSLYSLKSKFKNACDKKVWLKSGASLIIEQTESLTAIDVNSSKNIKGKISEDVIYQINLEAAREAAVQLRLRNLSGIIIIDFINMRDKEHENALLTYLSELTAKDPVATRVIDMTPLGLVEITRKKINKSLKEQLVNEIC